MKATTFESRSKVELEHLALMAQSHEIFNNIKRIECSLSEPVRPCLPSRPARSQTPEIGQDHHHVLSEPCQQVPKDKSSKNCRSERISASLFERGGIRSSSRLRFVAKLENSVGGRLLVMC
jgi:hypothetical protein